LLLVKNFKFISDTQFIVEKEILEKEILRRLMKYFPKLEVGKEAKVVMKKYLKYKEEGRWKRIPIANFDNERNISLRCLKQILENLFEEVEFTRMRVPFFVSLPNSISPYMIPKTFEDNVLVSRRLKPIFERRYKGIDHKTARMISVYVGGSYTFYYYWDENTKEEKVIDELVEDIKYLHTQCWTKRIVGERLNEFVFSHYSDVFPKLKPVLTLPEPKEKKAEVPTVEVEKPIEKVEVPSAEETPQVKRRAKRKVKKEGHKPSEVFSTDYGTIDKEEIQKVITEYKPEPTNFFGVVAKTKYESLLRQIKDEEKRRKLDFLFYQFIKLTGNAATKEFYTKFNEKLSELLNQTT